MSSGLNGTSASDLTTLKHRYFLQWVTEHNTKKSGAAQITVVGWCIRDQHSPNWDTVFEHEDRQVCEKMLVILNEG
jgi:hypothetical protein